MVMRVGGVSSCRNHNSEVFSMLKWAIVFLCVSFVILDSCSKSPYCSGIVSPTSSTPVTQNIPGFIGLYHNSTGTIYGGWGWPSGELIQTAFNFGINAVISQAQYYGYTFQTNLVDNCTVWNTNKVYGILRPPSEGGVVNQPGDTSALQPFAQSPGMIQGAHRFSELSKEYPQISGIIIDDFFENFQEGKITLAQLQQIREALEGKTLDGNGNVEDTSQATTPNLKLYVVVYEDQLGISSQSVVNSIDGVNLWMHHQNENYTNLDQYISTVKQNYPSKRIIVGVYFKNSLEQMTPVGIKYLIQNSIDMYDQGEINGVLLFSAPWLTQQYITQQLWDSLAIPPFLDSLYYPNLGEATGTVIDAHTGNPVANALVTVQRLTGKYIQLVSRKFTSDGGEYSFGGWAGKNSGSSYEVAVAKAPYQPRTFDVELQPGMQIVLPEIQLKQ